MVRVQHHPKPSAGNVVPGHPFNPASPSTFFHNPCDSSAPTLPHHFPLHSPQPLINGPRST
ncbi:hypothetical protein CROQUDRAFT_100126 [Cronartium quercuum f. sp. fusiforme G11]|uniref:Uncharacterized protein n=1 Tax=Cronartium quercuum f. sp. fusiforme G11 TaxID=708437 RepID=A0A9P6NA38_9BASI|nr:hypothetical protein CROQUDRAFT_100126 [Cronartium quercuum f. sp. fusiforme G11]